MIKLIQNELMKIFWRKSTWLMFLVITLLVGSSSIIIRSYNVFPNTNIWDGIENQLWVVFFLKIFTLVITGSIVADEYNWGTIKLLLIHPASRSKILLSKYFTAAIFSLLLILTLFGSAFIVNAIIYGFNNPANNYMLGKKLLYNTFDKIALVYVLKYLELFIYGTIAFMFSVLSRSSAFAIGCSFIIMFLGPQITSYIYEYSWSKYLLFTNIDLTNYIGINPIKINGMTLQFSLAVIIIYLVIFNFFSWIVFMKRDVN